MKRINLVYLLVLMFFISFASCEKSSFPNESVKDKALGTRDYEYEINCHELDETAVELGIAIGELVDEIFKDGFEITFDRWEYFENNWESIPYDQLKDSIIVIFNLRSSIVEGFVESIVLNQLYLLDNSNKEEVIKGIYCYAISSDHSYHGGLQYRFVFRALAEVLGAEKCSFWTMFGGIADTAAGAAVTVTTFNIPALVGTIGSAAVTINEFAECSKRYN